MLCKCSTLEACITVGMESQSIAKAIRGRRPRLAAAVVPGDARGTPAAPPSRQTVSPPPNGAREAGISPSKEIDNRHVQSGDGETGDERQDGPGWCRLLLLPREGTLSV